MIRVHVPATPAGLQPEVIRALTLAGATHIEIGICRGPADYSGLLLEWWAQAESDLTLVEHDVVVHDRVLGEFISCSHPWCCFPYDRSPDGSHGPGSEALLGCTRFRPAALADVLSLRALRGIRWQQLDMEMYALLIGRGIRPHRHTPGPLHLHR